MKDITLSLNPSYLCNFRCNFCYLKEEQLRDKTKLQLDNLEKKLNEIYQHTSISHIDLYGGEIALLDLDYLLNMEQIIRKKYSGSINIITNLSILSPFFQLRTNTISVSWDYKLRQNHEEVLNNIKKLGRDVHILMLASPQMLTWTKEQINELITSLNKEQLIKSLEIKPYSPNQANNFATNYKDFESLIIRWLEADTKKNFQFINEENIQLALAKTKSSWSDDHIYLTPQGHFAVLEFDNNDQEFFLEMSSFSEYIKWYQEERNKINSNSFCSTCSFLGNCLSEHLRDVKDLTKSCNGFKGLLEYYATQRS